MCWEGEVVCSKMAEGRTENGDQYREGDAWRSSCGVSSRLEEILSDTRKSYGARIREAIVVELATLFKLAVPAVVVYLITNIISMSTQMFCGHLGNTELAAAALGNTGIQVFAYGVMVIPVPIMKLTAIEQNLTGHPYVSTVGDAGLIICS